MHSSAAPSAAIFESDKGQDHPPVSPEPLGALGSVVAEGADCLLQSFDAGAAAKAKADLIAAINQKH